MLKRARKLKKKQELDATAQAWLAGDPACGLFQFKSDQQLETVWREYGDDNAMFWRPGMMLPIPIEDAEAEEQRWLDSGHADEYGRESYFIHTYYTDKEKQALYEDRGDKKNFYWRRGMRGPEPIQGQQERTKPMARS
jgi:hypothetical protein